MIKEIPFPTPLSVILSPSHKINILPAAIIMVDDTVNHILAGKDAPTAFNCTLKLIRYVGPCRSKIAIVK